MSDSCLSRWDRLDCVCDRRVTGHRIDRQRRLRPASPGKPSLVHRRLAARTGVFVFSSVFKEPKLGHSPGRRKRRRRCLSAPEQVQPASGAELDAIDPAHRRQPPARRNLDHVIRLLALAQQQVTIVQQGHRGQVVARTELDAVGPGRTLLEEAPGVAARAGQVGGDEQVDRVAELVGAQRCSPAPRRPPCPGPPPTPAADRRRRAPRRRRRRRRRPRDRGRASSSRRRALLGAPAFGRDAVLGRQLLDLVARGAARTSAAAARRLRRRG